jgi:multicomponent Na+:H+ antiporter subunit E
MRVYFANLIIALGATAYLRIVWPVLAETGLRTIGVFLVICVLLWLLSFFYNRRFFRQLPRIMHLTVYFIKELIVANIKVTYEVLTVC